MKYEILLILVMLGGIIVFGMNFTRPEGPRVTVGILGLTCAVVAFIFMAGLS